MKHRRIERRVTIPWRTVIAAGLLAVCVSLPTPHASASETQSEALARLDQLVLQLKQIRSRTRSQDTLEAALESSVSRYSCARFWAMGIAEGAIGVDAKAYMKAKASFQVPLPFVGWVTTYALDNGTPLYIGAEANGSVGKALDVMGGIENWNCWPEDSFFDNPDLYNIADYESDYVHDLPQGSNQNLRTAAGTSGGAASPGTAAAIDMLNGLAATLRQIGLDPSDPQVVHRVLADGGLAAIGELASLAGAGKSLPERALGASEDLIDLMGAYAPDPATVGQVSSYLATDWTSLNPCSMLPQLWNVCDAAQAFKDAMVTAFGELQNLAGIFGPMSTQINQMNGIGGTLIGTWHGGFTTMLTGLDQTVSALGVPIGLIVSHANQLLSINLASEMNALVDAVSYAEETVADVEDYFYANWTKTYSMSLNEYFSVSGRTIWCHAGLQDVSAQDPRLPTIGCQLY